MQRHFFRTAFCIAITLLATVSARADDKERRGAWTLSTLQTLRSQFELYKIQHEDRVPSLPQIADWVVMLGKSDLSGPNPKGKFGPYLIQKPVNIFNGKTKVVLTGQATAEAGWTFSFDNKGYYLRIVVPDEETMKNAGLTPRDAEIAK